MVFRTIILLFSILLSVGCTHQVKLIGGITSVILEKEGTATRSNLANSVKSEFYGKQQGNTRSRFPTKSAKPWVLDGLAKALKIPSKKIGAKAFVGDPKDGFESAIDSEELACVTYYISDIGLLINKGNKNIYRVSIGYQALVELQGRASSDENLAIFADGITDSLRLAIVIAARRAGWKLSKAELKREKTRKTSFPFETETPQAKK